MIIISTCASKDNPGKDNPLPPAGVSWIRRLAGSLRRLADRRFAINDAEAQWWGWQITKTSGGLSRHYRDPRFDTLGEVSQPRASTAGSGTAGKSSA